MLDVTVQLYDGKYHPVDSKDIAFQIAGRKAVKQAVMESRPVLLEPVYAVDVVVPAGLVGEVIGDMNSRRGRVVDMETRGRNAVVKALVPLAELLTYSPDLRSMTAGKGSYTMAMSGYEQVPSHLQGQIVAEVTRLTAADDDD
ncbi:MAG: elongation factor G [Myxococcota bacterium]